MRIIDAHTHIFPQKIVNEALAATNEFYPYTVIKGKGTPEDLLETGRKAGIDRFVVFSAATAPHQVVSINDFIIGVCAEHPEFIGVGTMHKDFENYEAELARIYSLGIRGIKVHPDIQKTRLDDEKMLDVYSVMNDLGMFLIAHTGDYRYDYSQPHRLARVAKMFPDMRFIGAHFGGWSQWDEAREYLDLPNVYFDTSSTMQFAGLEPALKAFETFAPDHFFFASDYPTWDPRDEIEQIKKLGLDRKALEGVFHGNFEKFYSFYGSCNI